MTLGLRSYLFAVRNDDTLLGASLNVEMTP